MMSTGYIIIDGNGVAWATISSQCGKIQIGTKSPARKPETTM